MKNTKGLSPESMKPTKKMLEHPYDYGTCDTTIGEMTLDQLRVALYLSEREYTRVEGIVSKAIAALERFY